jgi:hypothetical protein
VGGEPGYRLCARKNIYFIASAGLSCARIGLYRNLGRHDGIEMFLLHQLPHHPASNHYRRKIMAKGQQRKTKEAKKPKKQPVPAKAS